MSNTTTPELNPDLVYDLFGGIFKPQFVRIALQLDVFTPLAAGANTAERVARACRCDASGIGALLDYLCSLEVLKCDDHLYSLTPTAAAFLVKGKEAYAGDLILRYTDQAFFDRIERSLRTGKPSSLRENFVQDAWLESYLPWRIPKSLEMWKAAGMKPEHRETVRVLDIACGCAIKSLALAQVSASVQVTCLDSAEVLVVARDLAQRMGVESQVIFEPANLLEAGFGVSGFDAVLLGQITHYLTQAQNLRLFKRVYTTLSPNGILVLDCPMASNAAGETTSFLTLVLWANSGGAAHSFEQYRTWLGDSGFQQIRQLSERWVVATKQNGD